MEEEKAAIHAEYEQERIAYQKLLKDFNRMEAATENLQDEVGLFDHCQNLLSEIFSSPLFLVIIHDSSPIPPGEHSARGRRPSQRCEHGGGRRERLWQRLGPQ